MIPSTVSDSSLFRSSLVSIDLLLEGEDELLQVNNINDVVRGRGAVVGDGVRVEQLLDQLLLVSKVQHDVVVHDRRLSLEKVVRTSGIDHSRSRPYVPATGFQIVAKASASSPSRLKGIRLAIRSERQREVRWETTTRRSNLQNDFD